MEKQFNADDLKKIVSTFTLERELNCRLKDTFKSLSKHHGLTFGNTTLPLGSMYSFNTKHGKRETVEMYRNLQEMRFKFAIDFNDDGSDYFFGVTPKIEFNCKVWQLPINECDIKGFAKKLPIMYFNKPRFDGAEGLYFINLEAYLLIKQQIEKIKPEIETVYESMRSLMSFNVD